MTVRLAVTWELRREVPSEYVLYNRVSDLPVQGKGGGSAAVYGGPEKRTELVAINGVEYVVPWPDTGAMFQTEGGTGPWVPHPLVTQVRARVGLGAVQLHVLRERQPPHGVGRRPRGGRTLMGFFVRWVARMFFGNPIDASAAAEWCETDPREVVVMCDGTRVPVHVFVTVRTKDKHLLQDWKKQEELWVAGGPGIVVVTGPTCEFRTWAEYRKTKPFTIIGPELEVQPPLRIVTLTVPAGLGQ